MISLLDVLRRIDSNQLNPKDAVQRCIAEVDRRDDHIKAFVSVNHAAKAEAAGELRGITFGVKDIIDTADLPTEMGSPIYAGWRPKADASVVAALREAGATLLGKTSSTPFAHLDPTPTRNPRNPDHTPGGSSSGSAAAVAAGMVHLSIGTQSSGSTIRPASFCGVAAIKPTFRLVPTVGVKCSSWSLDTIGLFAATVSDVAFALASITKRPGLRTDQATPPTPRVGVMLQEFAGDPEPASAAALERGIALIEKAGAVVRKVATPRSIAAAAAAQVTIQDYELRRSLAWEYRFHSDRLSAHIKRHIENGEAISRSAYESALMDRRLAMSDLARTFEEFHVLLTFSAPGAAPVTLERTGDPRYNAAWTVAGNPCVNVPGLADDFGMPVGLQVIGSFGQDAPTLASARFVEAVLVAGARC